MEGRTERRKAGKIPKKERRKKGRKERPGRTEKTSCKNELFATSDFFTF